MTNTVATTSPLTAKIADTLGLPVWEWTLIAGGIVFGLVLIAILIWFLINWFK